MRSKSYIWKIITCNYLILLAFSASAQDVPGTVIFHQPEEKQSISPETPFRKVTPEPPEKPRIPKVNSPVVPGSDPVEEPKPEEPTRRPLSSQRRRLAPPPELLPGIKLPAPKEMPEGRKPTSLIEASPIVFAQSPIAIYPWMEKEEYFDYDPKNVINLSARISRSDEVVIPDNLSRIKFMEDHGVLTIFPRPQIATIPLDHIYFSQDILFLDDEGIIRQMVYRTESRSPKPITSKTECRSALQLNAGSIQKFGLKVGDKVAIPAQ